MWRMWLARQGVFTILENKLTFVDGNWSMWLKLSVLLCSKDCGLGINVNFVRLLWFVNISVYYFFSVYKQSVSNSECLDKKQWLLILKSWSDPVCVRNHDLFYTKRTIYLFNYSSGNKKNGTFSNADTNAVTRFKAEAGLVAMRALWYQHRMVNVIFMWAV